MREISVDDIAKAVAHLCKEANFSLGKDVINALKRARESEESSLGREILEEILENAAVAAREHIPLCQDCGITIVYLEIGQEVCIIDGDLTAAVDEGIRRGYSSGYLRNSMVRHPFSARANTCDNTPAIVRTEIVPGGKLKITVMPKGEGAENASAIAMLEPAKGRQGIIDFVVDIIDKKGNLCCPPLIVGVGIGGTAGRVMTLAKKALLRPVGSPNPDPEIADLERELLQRINSLGIGPQGLGGTTTALAVHVESFPCHIAALPVAVNPQCHSHRLAQATL